VSPSQIIDDAKQKLQTVVTHYQSELKKVRTGRAHAAMLDSVMVEAYGTPMPLNQVATVTAPEAQLLQITPFDPNNLQAIASAIRDNQSLGFNPMDDGRVVRVPVPALTEERRRELVKLLGGKVEDCMISLRSVRHAAMGAIDSAKKDKLIGEDEAKRMSAQIDEAMTKTKNEVEAAAKAKEAEIMTI